MFTLRFILFLQNISNLNLVFFCFIYLSCIELQNFLIICSFLCLRNRKKITIDQSNTILKFFSFWLINFFSIQLSLNETYILYLISVYNRQFIYVCVCICAIFFFHHHYYVNLKSNKQIGQNIESEREKIQDISLIHIFYLSLFFWSLAKNSCQISKQIN